MSPENRKFKNRPKSKQTDWSWCEGKDGRSCNQRNGHKGLCAVRTAVPKRRHGAR